MKVRFERLETSQGASHVDTQEIRFQARDQSKCKALKQAHAWHAQEMARTPGWNAGAAGRGGAARALTSQGLHLEGP